MNTGKQKNPAFWILIETAKIIFRCPRPSSQVKIWRELCDVIVGSIASCWHCVNSCSKVAWNFAATMAGCSEYEIRKMCVGNCCGVVECHSKCEHLYPNSHARIFLLWSLSMIFVDNVTSEPSGKILNSAIFLSNLIPYHRSDVQLRCQRIYQMQARKSKSIHTSGCVWHNSDKSEPSMMLNKGIH